MQEVTPNINSDAMISEDMLVFDLDSTISPEWMRIWALRESKLPVRLRMWDPRDGECMDVFVTYEKQQPAEFFDHQKYEQLLKVQPAMSLLAYNDIGIMKLQLQKPQKAIETFRKAIELNPSYRMAL